MLRRTLVTAALAALAVTTAALPVRAADDKPKNAAALQKVLDQLYGKLDFNDVNQRGIAQTELNTLVAKDRKDDPLRRPGWWSDAIRQAMYGGDKIVTKNAATKQTTELKLETYPNGLNKPKAEATCWFRGPNNYSKKKPAPLLISVLPAGTDAKAYLEKVWAANDEVAKEWVLVAAAMSDAFDPAKEKTLLASVLGKMMYTYHVDPNRVFVEAVGAACDATQIGVSFGLPDRMAGLVLRSPEAVTLNENCSLFPTVVVHADGGDKSAAALGKVREMVGEAMTVDLVTPDAGSMDAPCVPVTEWLKAAAPRQLAASYSWVTTFDQTGSASNDFTGSVRLRTPAKKGEPTRLKVAFDRTANTVTLESTNLGEYEIWMNDELLDLDREVTITVNGAEVSKRVFDRRLDSMLSFADAYFEYGRVYPAMYSGLVAVPAEAPKDEGKDGAKKPDDAGGDKK